MRPAFRALAAVVVIVVVIGGVAAAAYLLLFPSSAQREEGIPTLEYYTTDLAGALSEDDLYYIDGICDVVNENSTCEMAVVVVNTTYPHDIEHYALRTFQYNGIGKEGRDNGVLVVVATDDQEWRIEVGYGLEGVLTDVRVFRLAEEFLVPNMTAGSYGDGLFELTYAMGTILEDEYSGDRSPVRTYPISWIPLTWNDWMLVGGAYVVLVIATRGWALRPLLLILALVTGGRGGFGGGRSGGGGASGGR